MTAPAYPLFEQDWPEGEFRFFQLGHVVDDLISAARRWSSTFGIGPFHVLPVVDQQLTLRNGDEHTLRVQVGVAQAGPVQIELIQQHDDTPSVYRDWSKNATSAFHQVATVTSDYTGKLAHFEALGHEVAAEARRKRPDLKVLFITGFAENVFGDSELPEGTAVMTKPFVMSALGNRLRDLLDRG